MPNVLIRVTNKIAQPVGHPTIVCGNRDYTVTFMLDSEWDGYVEKTARFNYVRDGVRRHQDVVFSGLSCAIPVMDGVYAVEIGVYAGSIHTSTLARIPCERSATDDAERHPDPMPDIYDQLLEYLAKKDAVKPFAFSDVQAISPGGVANDITAIAEEES